MRLIRQSIGLVSEIFRNALSVRGISSSPCSAGAAQRTQKKQWKDSSAALYRRISPVGDRNVSIVPVLEQWVQEGHSVGKDQLQTYIKELRRYKRYTDALQISMWMSDKMYIPLSRADVAIRLDLIAKVHGIEQAEKYFSNISEKLKGLEVYSALLNSYARAKCIKKAEAVMENMKELGFARTTLCHNLLLSLYYQTGDYERLDTLLQEMEKQGIGCDSVTFGILVSAYAAKSDVEGIDKTLRRMESDTNICFNWSAFATVASAYTKAGAVEKALAMLKKSEELISMTRKRRKAYEFLISQYASVGMKEDVLRLWEAYKEKAPVYNRGYISIITSLLKLDDIDRAEKIYEEWESRNLACDIRIPNFLIGAYSSRGDMEKAEALKDRVVSKGGRPDSSTWKVLSTGYIRTNQTGKAVEAMKEAIILCRPGWKPKNEILIACLEYFKENGDVDGAVDFIRLLQDKDVVPVDNNLLDYVKNRNFNIPSFGQAEEDISDEREELCESSDSD